LELSTHHEISSHKPESLPPQEDNGEQANEMLFVQVKSPASASKTLQQSEQRWDPEIHTIPSDADSYGTIFFDGFGQEASRKAPVSVILWIDG